MMSPVLDFNEDDLEDDNMFTDTKNHLYIDPEKENASIDSMENIFTSDLMSLGVAPFASYPPPQQTSVTRTITNPITFRDYSKAVSPISFRD